MIQQTMRLDRAPGYQLAPLRRRRTNHWLVISERFSTATASTACWMSEATWVSTMTYFVMKSGSMAASFSFEPVSKYSKMLLSKSAVDAKWNVFDDALGSSERTQRHCHAFSRAQFLSCASRRCRSGLFAQRLSGFDGDFPHRRLDAEFPRLQ
jgi:hypothetical protein